MSKQNFAENISLFDDETTEDVQLIAPTISKLDVVKAEFLEVQTLTWEELFTGFDKLYAIVYSSSVDFICKLLKKFETAEIIFGCEGVMSYSLAEIMAFQAKTLEKIKEDFSENKIDLITRIENNSLKMFVARKFLSHEKIYLLESNDGNKRVIMGSANMSNSAFSGRQRENISYIDGKRAFDWYHNIFEDLKEDSTDDISAKSIPVSDNFENLDLESIPIAQTVILKKGTIIEQQFNQSIIDEKIKFALDVKNLTGKFKPLVPKADKSGVLKILPETLKQIRKRFIDIKVQERELRREYPQLIINVETKTVELNGFAVNLNPNGEEITRDVNLFLDYMNGFEKFHGDTKFAQARYFEFANWFFVSPFMAVMRYTATQNNQNLLPYPVFGLLYGQSKAGKTSFLETLLKMMIGQKTKMQAGEFTRSSIEGLKRTVKGAPIIADDLTPDRFRAHAVETIKNEDFGLSENLLNYPAVVISANEDVKAVAPEIVRRTIMCRVQIGQKNTEIMQSNIVRRVQKDIGTAFYHEYMRRMLDEAQDMIEELKSDDKNSVPPDILCVSSKIINAIIKQYSRDENLPEYVRELTLDDYFSEKVTGAGVIKTIKSAWTVNKKAFVINKKLGQLSYNAAEVWEAERIMKELPEDLEAYKSREWVVMNLDKAAEFFGMDFRKKFWERIL